MKHNVFLNGNGVIENVYTGDLSYDDLKKVLEKNYEYAFGLEDLGKKVLILADVSNLKKVPATEITPIAVLGIKNLKFDKLAITGARPELMLLSKVIVGLAGKAKKVKLFKDREEGLKWLK
jgi:hypothetical protein